MKLRLIALLLLAASPLLVWAASTKYDNSIRDMDGNYIGKRLNLMDECGHLPDSSSAWARCTDKVTEHNQSLLEQKIQANEAIIAKPRENPRREKQITESASIDDHNMDALRKKCIAYGATPGSQEFFSCMRELDTRGSNQEEFKRRVNSECNNIDMSLKGQLACSSYENAQGWGCTTRNAEKFKQQCIRNIERQVFGAKTNTRRCTKQGNETICEDE